MHAPARRHYGVATSGRRFLAPHVEDTLPRSGLSAALVLCGRAVETSAPRRGKVFQEAARPADAEARLRSFTAGLGKREDVARNLRGHSAMIANGPTLAHDAAFVVPLRDQAANRAAARDASCLADDEAQFPALVGHLLGPPRAPADCPRLASAPTLQMTDADTAQGQTPDSATVLLLGPSSAEAKLALGATAATNDDPTDGFALLPSSADTAAPLLAPITMPIAGDVPEALSGTSFWSAQGQRAAGLLPSEQSPCLPAGLATSSPGREGTRSDPEAKGSPTLAPDFASIPHATGEADSARLAPGLGEEETALQAGGGGLSLPQENGGDAGTLAVVTRSGSGEAGHARPLPPRDRARDGPAAAPNAPQSLPNAATRLGASDSTRGASNVPTAPADAADRPLAEADRDTAPPPATAEHHGREEGEGSSGRSSDQHRSPRLPGPSAFDPGSSAAAEAEPGPGAALFGPRTARQVETAPQPAAAPHRPSLPVARQIAPALVTLALGPASSERLTLVLEPEELGTVEIAVARDSGKRVTIAVTVERPETLHLLQRDAGLLERALAQAGVGAEGRSLAFELGHSGHRHPGAGPRSGDGRAGSDAGAMEPKDPIRHRQGLLDIAV